MRTFLLPTKRSNKWLNPLDGKEINIEPMQVNYENELVELIAEEGSRARIKRHPAPANVNVKQGSSRGQLNDRDYNFLLNQGQVPQEIANMNNMFLLQNLRNQQ
tara:strand:+ start:5539 stop:5850 length:312 start_codon:yes stop_codon:yes gene_type:complete